MSDHDVVDERVRVNDDMEIDERRGFENDCMRAFFSGRPIAHGDKNPQARVEITTRVHEAHEPASPRHRPDPGSEGEVGAERNSCTKKWFCNRLIIF